MGATRPYLKAAAAAGVVDVTDGALSALDPGPVRTAAARLVAALENPAPAPGDVAFVVLADAGRIARPHLGGGERREHRARLRGLRRQAARGDAGRLLLGGEKAVAVLSSSADSRTIDQQ